MDQETVCPVCKTRKITVVDVDDNLPPDLKRFFTPIIKQLDSTISSCKFQYNGLISRINTTRKENDLLKSKNAEQKMYLLAAQSELTKMTKKIELLEKENGLLKQQSNTTTTTASSDFFKNVTNSNNLIKLPNVYKSPQLASPNLSISRPSSSLSINFPKPSSSKSQDGFDEFIAESTNISSPSPINNSNRAMSSGNMFNNGIGNENSFLPAGSGSVRSNTFQPSQKFKSPFSADLSSQSRFDTSKSNSIFSPSNIEINSGKRFHPPVSESRGSRPLSDTRSKMSRASAKKVVQGITSHMKIGGAGNPLPAGVKIGKLSKSRLNNGFVPGSLGRPYN